MATINMSASPIVTGYKLRLNAYLTKYNIEGFAVRNSRDRFLIPSSPNTFGSMQVDYVLIDSGSNSALFPLPTTPTLKFDIDSLIRNFPYDKFLWTIGTAHGVGLLPDTKLHIKPMADNGSSLNEIPCSLHTDIKPLTFAIPYIRFTLGNGSMIVLTQTASIPFSEADRDTLQTALTFLYNFEVQFPAMINAKRGACCLLGQQFLKNVCSIQLNELMIFVDKQKLKHRLFPPLPG